MQATTPAFEAAIAAHENHIETRVDVLFNGELRDDLDLQVQDGRVTMDRTRDTWRDFQLTVVDGSGTLVPDTFKDELAPNGTELQIWRGVPGDLKSLGVFVLEEVDSTDTDVEFTIQLNGLDRSARFRWAGFSRAYVVKAGTPVTAAIRQMLNDGVSGIGYDLAQVDGTTTLLTYDAGADRWQSAKKLAKDNGMELYLGYDGRVKMKAVPDPSSDPPVYAYVAGEGGIVVQATRRMTRNGVANVAMVSVEHPNNKTPFLGVAMDKDPTSPTYVGDPPGSSAYGMVTVERKVQTAQTQAQADAAAAADLRTSKNAVEQVDFTALVNPALDPSDIVTFARPRLKLAGAPWVLHTATVPLRAKDPGQYTILKNPAITVASI